MRIYHLSAATVPSRTANSIQTMKMSAALVALGHEVTLFCVRGEPGRNPYDYYGVDRAFEIVHAPWPAVRFVGSLWYARRVVREIRRRRAPDLFYGRHLGSLALAARVDRPVIAEVHLPPSHGLQRALAARLFGSPRLDRLVVISHALRTEYLRLFPALSAKKVVVAPSGADDLPAVVPGPPLPAGRPGAPQVGYVGHLYSGKGVEMITALAPMMPRVDFHVVGGAERDLVQWRARIHQPNVILHGHVPPAAVPSWLHRFDIVLAPYQARVSVDGGGDAARWMSPLKLVEYMAAGRPIVASDLPVIREILDDGRTALLRATDQATAWREAIQGLIDRPQMARQIGDAARQTFAARHTWVERARHLLA
jgi:glycosyltransferase involved in cell wall biosynthesis